MPTVITKKSTVAGKVPVAGDFSAVGELAVNTADGKLYTKHNDDSVVLIGGTHITVSSTQPSNPKLNDLWIEI